MKAYKLLKQRKDGSLGPLFINARQRIPVGVWLDAESHPTKGYAVRPGWHACSRASAPHLAKNPKHGCARVWVEVDLEDYAAIERPKAQGGLWYLANRMRVVRVIG
jgi:hypothetical protein